MTFEWIPNTTKPRVMDDELISKRNEKKNELEKLNRRLVKSYLRKCSPSRWFIEKASKLNWSEKDFERMNEELMQTKEEKKR